MTTKSLPDLPVEILLPIFAAAFKPNTLGPYPRFHSRQHYSRLGRVCHQFYSLIKPILWEDIHIEDPETLRLFYDTVSFDAKSNCGVLVNQFTFTCDTDRFGDDESNVLNLLQGVFERLRQLKKLNMHNRSRRDLEFSFDLYCDETLQEINIWDYSCSPEAVDKFFAMKSLQSLCLAYTTSEKSWGSRTPTIKNNLKTLKLIGQHGLLSPSGRTSQPAKVNGIPNHVLKSILSCCSTVEELDIAITKSSCSSGELENILAKLNKHSGVKRLSLSSREDLQPKLSYGFSSWQYLTHLSLHSTMLWPLRDSWTIRCEFYRTLPPTLISLRIRFPCAIPFTYGSAPYDGIFQLNVNEGHREEYQYCNQVIPQSRYTWLFNLLGNDEDAAVHVRPYMPCLKNINLTENLVVSGDLATENNTPFSTRTTEPFWLPDEMVQMFVGRSVKLDIRTVSYADLLDGDDPVSESSGSYGMDEESDASEISIADGLEQSSSNNVTSIPVEQRDMRTQRSRRGRGRTS